MLLTHTRGRHTFGPRPRVSKTLLGSGAVAGSGAPSHRAAEDPPGPWLLESSGYQARWPAKQPGSRPELLTPQEEAFSAALSEVLEPPGGPRWQWQPRMWPGAGHCPRVAQRCAATPGGNGQPLGVPLQKTVMGGAQEPAPNHRLAGSPQRAFAPRNIHPRFLRALPEPSLGCADR